VFVATCTRASRRRVTLPSDCLAPSAEAFARARFSHKPGLVFRTLELRRDGTVQVKGGLALVSPPTTGTLRWIDLSDPNGSLLAFVGERFGFHAIALENCASAGQQPKAHAYEDYLFVITCGFAPPSSRSWSMGVHELCAFVGDGYLVTIHLREIPVLDAVWRRVEREPELLGRGPDFVYCLLAHGLANDSVLAVERIADEVERVETGPDPSRGELGHIGVLKHQVMEMRKVACPQRDCMAGLLSGAERWLSKQTLLHIRDVHARLSSIVEALDANRDWLAQLGEASAEVPARPARLR
jgi:magnesium transporter